MQAIRAVTKAIQHHQNPLSQFAKRFSHLSDMNDPIKARIYISRDSPLSRLKIENDHLKERIKSFNEGKTWLNGLVVGMYLGGTLSLLLKTEDKEGQL